MEHAAAGAPNAAGATYSRFAGGAAQPRRSFQADPRYPIARESRPGAVGAARCARRADPDRVALIFVQVPRTHAVAAVSNQGLTVAGAGLDQSGLVSEFVAQRIDQFGDPDHNDQRVGSLELLPPDHRRGHHARRFGFRQQLP